MITVKRLNFEYDHNHKALNQISLELYTGRIYGLLGKNGAGKTSLLKNILGLRKSGTGDISVFGFDPRKSERAFLASYFFIPEDPHIPDMSMKEYIECHAPFYPDFNLDHFFQILNEFELPRKLNFGKVSLGQKKKALISFGIAANTPLLVMDEPTNGLDIPSKKQLRKIINSLVNDKRLFIISTHQVRDLHSLIDHVIVLDDGEIVVDNSIQMIERALSFEVHRHESSAQNSIYYEKVPGGFLSINEGGERPESLAVDMEVLFNAVITEKKLFNHILKYNNHGETTQ